MTIHDFMTLFSLYLTPITVISAAMVIIVWWKASNRALATKEKSAVNWLILGVTIGFIGSLVDNLYWGAAWTADYLQADIRNTLFNNGVYANTPFRQGAGTLAALCHIRGAMIAGERLFKSTIIYGLFIGTLFVIALVVLKYWYFV